ncbi:TPA: DapH/DapD/GlmU-related protein [Vibrio mimicus]
MSKLMIKNLCAEDLANVLGLKVLGEKGQLLSKVVSLNDAQSEGLCFSKATVNKFINGIVIGPQGSLAQTVLVSENPRLHFCRALSYFVDNGYLDLSYYETYIDDTVTVAQSAIIESGVSIGENSVIEHNVVIHSGTKIGKNCIIRSGSILGAQGFGFEKNEDGIWERFQHIGGLSVGDNVEIGAMNSVCVGALDDTIIGNGVKTDNLVHIAHNCKIGKNSILTACVELSGGVIIGENVWIGPNTSTKQKIVIGDNALIGVGSVVMKDVQANHVVAGNPAKIIKRG